MAFFRSSGIALAIVAIASGCWRTDNQALNDGDTDTGTGGDSDSDADSDGDSDGDTDSDSDTDTDTWPDPDTAPDGYGEIVETCWVTVVDCTDYAHATDLVVLADGSSVLAGRFNESLTFDPGGSGETSLQETAGGSFLARFDPDGGFMWVRQFEVEHIDDIAVDALDRVVVLGRYFGEGVLSAGAADEQAFEGNGECDLFLARYSPDGSIDWARQDGGDEDVRPTGLGVLANGMYVVVGSFNSETTFGVGEEHETTIDTGLGTTLFIATYQEDGTVFWVRTDCDNGCNAGRDVAAHPTDGVFMITGHYYWQATFGIGSDNEVTLTASDYGGSDEYLDMGAVFFAAYDLMGDLLWVESAGSNATCHEAYGTALSDGSFVASGMYYGDLYFEYGQPDETQLSAPVQETDGGYGLAPGMFAARFGEGGDLAWALGSDNSWGNNATGTRAIPLEGGRFVIPGRFTGAVNFGLGDPAETWLVASNFGEPYGAVYDENGDLVWVARIGANWTDGGAVVAAGLGDGNFLMAGQFQGSVDFQVGPDEWETYDAGEGSDVFLAKVCPQF